MATALQGFLAARRDIGGVLGLGGTGNTALVTAALRALPIGLPKLMVSTVASGNVAPYVGPSDIALMHAVVDIAGLNPISRKVIGNAANAMAGMMRAGPVASDDVDRPSVGITMFGVTTACVNEIRRLIDQDRECFVFHATGTGGQSLEKLVDSGLLNSVIDVTTTEVADFLFGGVFPCTDDRFGAVARTRTPCVASVGAVDMVNFGAIETVPDYLRTRRLHVHNPQVTLMRTTPAESAAIGRFIAERLSLSDGPVRLLLPLGGVSAIDRPGQPFHDPDADGALFAAVRSHFRPGPDRRLVEIPAHINDPAFAAALVAAHEEIAR
jgi:uncharacterized protein (UPF0261 family)